MKKAKVIPETTSETSAPIETAVKEKTVEKNVSEATAPHPAQKPVNKVGSLLKEMRLQKGLRLPDVAKRLCIRKIYLEAIEDSNYKELPPFPYGVGFIRSYADYLGLNSSNIVELYKEETNTKTDKDIYVLEPQSEATVPNRKYLVISLLSIILVYVLWYFYNNQTPEAETITETAAVEETGSEAMPIVVEDYAAAPESAETEAPLSETEPAPLPDHQVTITEASFIEPLPEAEQPEAVAEEQPAIEEPAAEETGVVVKIKAETWIEVKDGSKLYISKVLQPGTEYVVPEGGKGMILSVGKVEGADVYINGKLTQVARPGKKTNIALDPFIAATH